MCDFNTKKEPPKGGSKYLNETQFRKAMPSCVSKKSDLQKQAAFQESSGIEPLHRGFADLSLTTWVRLHVFKA